jgi:uncharacterized membrane protein YoaK (UPF0700 family)
MLLSAVTGNFQSFSCSIGDGSASQAVLVGPAKEMV